MRKTAFDEMMEQELLGIAQEKKGAAELAYSEYIKKIAAGDFYDQYGAPEGVFTKKEKVMPSQFNDPAYRAAEKNLSQAIEDKGGNPFSGMTLDQLIATRNKARKGTAEYADAQNLINKAYGSKVVHRPGTSSGQGKGAVTSIQGLEDRTHVRQYANAPKSYPYLNKDQGMAAAPVYPGVADPNYGQTEKGFTANVKPSDFEMSEAGVRDYTNAPDKESSSYENEEYFKGNKTSAASRVYDDYLKKIAGVEEDLSDVTAGGEAKDKPVKAKADSAIEALGKEKVKKTDTEAIIEEWSKGHSKSNTPPLSTGAVTSPLGKNTAKDRNDLRKKQLQNTSGGGK